jgi:voltage-gated potassium channel
MQVTLWRAVGLVVVAATALVLLAAVLIRAAEPATFPTLGTALWWAVVTVGTVGYGDVVPQTPRGRGIASAVILFGMAWVPLVAGLVVTALGVKLQERRSAGLEARLARIEEQLARIGRTPGRE